MFSTKMLEMTYPNCSIYETEIYGAQLKYSSVSKLIFCLMQCITRYMTWYMSIILWSLSLSTPFYYFS